MMIGNNKLVLRQSVAVNGNVQHPSPVTLVLTTTALRALHDQHVVVKLKQQQQLVVQWMLMLLLLTALMTLMYH
jgi:hypothetical protein